jgi:hypothetical protein
MRRPSDSGGKLHQECWVVPQGVRLPKMGVLFTETGCFFNDYLFNNRRNGKDNRIFVVT